MSKFEVPKHFNEVVADYLHSEIDPSHKLYRYDRLEDRFYFRFTYHPKWNNPIKTHSYISITSLGQKLIPMGAAYYKWLMSLGANAMVEKNKKAIFGSLFHREAFRPLKKNPDPIHGRGYNFDYLDEIVPGHFYFSTDNEMRPCTQLHMMVPPEWRYDVENWRYAFKRGLMSWFQFIQEKVERVIAVEIPLCSDKHGVALTIDLVCDLVFYNKPRRSIVDVKSHLFLAGADKAASKSYFDAHRFQLMGCKHVWNENFGQHGEVTHVFNWSPKDWRGDTPTYTLKNQTENQYGNTIKIGATQEEFTVFELLTASAKAMGFVKPPTKSARISGRFDKIDSFSASNHIETFVISDDGVEEEKT